MKSKLMKIVFLVTIINLIAIIAVALKLPSIIPTHANVTGAIDAYGSRWNVLILAILPIVLLIAMEIYHRVTINNEKVMKNKKIEVIILPVIALFFTVLSWLPVLMAFEKGNKIDIEVALLLGLPFGLLMIILGNYMSVVKQNGYFGIRTPWTLKSEEVWRKTHRMGAYYSIAGGVIIIIFSLLSFFLNSYILVLVGYGISISLIAFIPIIYSYVIYKKLQNKNR